MLGRRRPRDRADVGEPVGRPLPQPAGEPGEPFPQRLTDGEIGMFCLTLMRIALELAKQNHVYEGLAIKFFQHYANVAAALSTRGYGAVTPIPRADEVLAELKRG